MGEVNSTNGVLIPKKKNPTRVAEFKIVSLCNVIYKIVTS